MSILEDLASAQSPILAARLDEHRAAAQQNDEGREVAAEFDNRPSWDNWTKKEPPFSKKTHYFRKK